MEAANWVAVSGVGTLDYMSGPRRSAASWESQFATMPVVVGPGSAALKRTTLGWLSSWSGRQRRGRENSKWRGTGRALQRVPALEAYFPTSKAT